MVEKSERIDTATLDRSRRLAKLYTGAVADILDELGLRNQCLPSDIRPLDPRMTVAGPVFTVRGRARYAHEGEDPRYRQIEMLENVTPGSIVMVDPGDESVAAHWGELMSRVARANGATGAVVAGGLRDCRQILDMGYPVFHRYFSPLTAVWRWELTEYNVRLEIGRVPIRPGDYVLGDIDGVLIIPLAVIDEVIERAEDVKTKELTVGNLLEAGGSIRTLFEKYRAF